MSDVLDLDALVPQPAVIRFGGNEIQVAPPKTADLLQLGALGQKLQNVDKLTDEQTEKLVGDLEQLVVRMVPQLANQTLNTSQLLGVVKLISEMSIPPDAKELERQGITPSGGKSDPKDQ